MSRQEKPYADPYLAGAALGLVLVVAFVLVGRGLGASGAFASAAAGALEAIRPESANLSLFFSRYLRAGGPWSEWLVFELAGVVMGGFLSAWLAGRLRARIERGPRIGGRPRLALAAGGGGVMGLGAVLAGGCTSGLALTGGALLSVGSWIFIGAAFAAAYLMTPMLRKVWR